MGCASSTPTDDDAAFVVSSRKSKGIETPIDKSFKNTSDESSPKVVEKSQSRILSQRGEFPRDDPEAALELDISSLKLTRFEFKHLSMATRGFREDAVLGEGGFGKVYKGFITNPDTKERQAVAVKRLNPDSGIQGHQQWINEIQLMAKLQHPNLIRLYGYCAYEGEAILVLEFMPLGSLDYHLFSGLESRAVESRRIPWKVRLRIASEVVEALLYLHQNRIIHRDIKAGNVLLDSKFHVKLTDFGLVKESDDGRTHLTVSKALGTSGYIDPAYAETGHLNSKSDVYSLGILFLELLTGRKSQEFSFPKWAMDAIQNGKKTDFSWLDPKILTEVSGKQKQEKTARRLAIIAIACVNRNPKERPHVADFAEHVKGFAAEE